MFKSRFLKEDVTLKHLKKLIHLYKKETLETMLGTYTLDLYKAEENILYFIFLTYNLAFISDEIYT